MPQFFDPFYEDLPCEMTAVDRLPVPDVDESSDDEEYDCWMIELIPSNLNQPKYKTVKTDQFG